MFPLFCNNRCSLSSQATYERMIGQIAQCEFTAKKSLLCSNMNNAEQKQYEELYLEIEKGIISAQSDIEATKIELHRAKQIRKNKMEYDALAAIIQSQPDRRTNQDKLAQLRQELESSETECHKLEMKLELRRKQFHLLVSSIQGLQQLLTDDEN